MDGEAAYLTLAQVAAITGRHPELLRQWAAAGRVPAKRLGNVWVMRSEDVPLVTAMTARSRSVIKRAIPSDGRLRVVAASFADDAAAGAAAAVLRNRIRADGVEVGTASVPMPASLTITLTIVAVRAPLARLVEARSILVGHGGTVVADIDAASDAAPAPVADAPVTRRNRRLSAAAPPA